MNPKVNLVIKTTREGIFEFEDVVGLHQHHALVVVDNEGNTHTFPWVNITFATAEKVLGEESSVH